MTQVTSNINGGRVEREQSLAFAAALNPVNMVFGALAEENFHGLAQLGQPPVALQQFHPHFVVFAGLDQFADGLAQALNGKRNLVLNQVWVSDAQLSPVSPA